MMQMKNFAFMFEDKPSIADSNAHPPDAHYVTSTTHDNPPGMWCCLATIVAITYFKPQSAKKQIKFQKCFVQDTYLSYPEFKQTANNVDPAEVAQYESSHLDLRSLYLRRFRCL